MPYDKHSCACIVIKGLMISIVGVISIVVQCIGMKWLMMNIVVQCIKIALLMLNIVVQ